MTLAGYAALFVILAAGPFVGRESIESFEMTWRIAETPSRSQAQAEVVLTFVDYPGHGVGEFSDRLAVHLQALDRAKIRATFRVTRDYGRVRSYQMTSVAGLTEWGSMNSYGFSNGDSAASPW